MATQHKPQQSWNDYCVTTFAGQHDTHVETGEDYSRISLAAIFAMEPQAKTKMAGAAFLPSQYCSYDARSHEAQRTHGSFIALVGDVDHGDLSFDAIKAATERFADGAAWLIYSSAHSRDGDHRWRIVLPLAAPIAFDEWFDAQTAFFTFMESGGIPMDRALSRAGQPVYLPNVPTSYKDGTPLRGADGAPIYYQTGSSGLDKPGLEITRGIVAGGIASIKQQRATDDRERALVRQAAAERLANRPRSDSANIIETFNASTSIATMLQLCGYEQSPRSPDDWRSPLQTGDTYATRIIEEKWVSLSASDTAAGVGSKCRSGCFGDAYDLYVHFKHGGDHKAAYRELGREQRGHNVVQGNFRADDGDPGWQEMPGWVSEDVEAYEQDVVAAATSTAIQPVTNLLPFEWFDEIDAQLEANWLVEELIPSQGLCLVYGHPGCGKSFFALDMAMHIAQGAPWRERDVVQGLVIYVGAEGQRGLRQRVSAFKKHHDIKELPFGLIPVEVNLLSEQGDLSRVVATIESVTARYGLPVAMIVIDTLSRTFGGGDEIGSDMVSYINNVGRLQHQFNCSTMVIHHRPKDSANETPRGHGSLWGACDTIILVEDKGGPKQAKVTKQKDAEPAAPVVFELRVVDLGEDEKGRTVTSCVVVGSNSKIAPDNRPDKLSDGQKVAFEQLCQTLAATGSQGGHNVPQNSLPHGFETRVCRVSEWMSRTGAALYDPDITPDSLAKNLRRYRNRLQTLGIIGVYEDFVWRIK